MKGLFPSGHARADCEGVTRRDALRVGALSAFGLTLPEFLRMRATQASPGARDRNCILLYMSGGPSHVDTWDPKPDAPTAIRGEFKPIASRADGVQICEHLPKMAGASDRCAIVRSVTSPEGSHERARHYMLTGYRVQAMTLFPDYGSVVLREKGFRTSLPPYVGIPQPINGAGPGYLGAAYQAFASGDPGRGNGFRVRDVSARVSEPRLQRRAALLRRENAAFEESLPDTRMEAVDAFYQRAYDLMESPAAKSAFDLGKEPDALKARYGRSSFGMGCLLARRLIEAGTRFVTVSLGGWDTHTNNFRALRDRLLPQVDAGFSTLLADLAERGMLDDTLVVWMGEFGRTPKINRTAGRDHWPRAQSVVLAGGGVRGGQAVGRSDAQAMYPDERPVTPEDLAATIYRVLGIDSTRSYESPDGRPLRIADGGAVVGELLA
jgi:hypothetical protein